MDPTVAGQFLLLIDKHFGNSGEKQFSCYMFMMDVVVCSCFRQRREPGQKPVRAALPQRQVRVCLCEHVLCALLIFFFPIATTSDSQNVPQSFVTANLNCWPGESVADSLPFPTEEFHWENMRLAAYFYTNSAEFGFGHCSLHRLGR